MGVLTVTGAEKSRMREGDRISSLPDDVLGDIVSLLPTKDGARRQVLSSRWRHLWRSAPLNFELPAGRAIRASEVSRILSAHPGPARRFVMPSCYDCSTLKTFDGWLCSPALNKLQELRIHRHPLLLWLPPSLGRFSSTLRVASLCTCYFPPLLLPVLESLTLSGVTISGKSLRALLAGSPVLRSVALSGIYGLRQLQIVSHSLRSIRVGFSWINSKLEELVELVIQDAPSLETIQCSEKVHMNISVISAPRLAVLSKICDSSPRLQFGNTVLQGSTVLSMAAAVHSVKVLSLSGVRLCLDAAIKLLKCFPHLEKLHIKATSICVENAWYQTNPERIRTLNIRLRKIVLENYQGSKSHIDFINFFLSNARVLESQELQVRNITTNKWIARQRSLLSIKSASRDTQVTFVSHTKNIKGSGSARVST